MFYSDTVGKWSVQPALAMKNNVRAEGHAVSVDFHEVKRVLQRYSGQMERSARVSDEKHRYSAGIRGFGGLPRS